MIEELAERTTRARATRLLAIHAIYISSDLVTISDQSNPTLLTQIIVDEYVDGRHGPDPAGHRVAHRFVIGRLEVPVVISYQYEVHHGHEKTHKSEYIGRQPHR